MALTYRITTSVMVACLLGCTPPADAPITEDERNKIIAEITVHLDSLTAAWTRADMAAMVSHEADSVVSTFNGNRDSGEEYWASVRAYVWSVASQEIGSFIDLRFDVLARDVVVTSWENQFVQTDTLGNRRPPQLALMTLVWVCQPVGWRILHYHESTRPANDGG